MRVLISGGSGFIGTHLSRRLLNEGHSVLVFDLVAPKLKDSGLTFIQGDVRSNKDIAQAITSDIDAIYHFAAIVSVPECERDPSAAGLTNVQGTKNILNRVIELNIEKKIRFFFRKFSSGLRGFLQIRRARFRIPNRTGAPFMLWSP